ncbi:MAG: alpha/beta hydrolase [Acidobacteriota bacterium]
MSIAGAIPRRKSTNGRIPPPWTVRLAGGALRGLEKVSPASAATCAGWLFCAPRRHRPPDHERRLLAGAERSTLRVEGDSLPAWIWGQGPTVLLVHGWEGRAGQLGTLATALAGAGVRAIAFDAPGHGGARWRLSSGIQFAAAIHAARERFGPLRAVVAHSLGCTAASLAVLQGLQPQRLVFLAPAADLGRFTRGFGDLLGLAPATVRRMEKRFDGRFSMRWDTARRANLEAAEFLADAPLLVVHDRDDHEVPHAGGAAIADAWRRGRLLTTHGLGHRRILRHPQVVNEVVAFLAPR